MRTAGETDASAENYLELEGAGYAEQRKSTVDGRQRTWVSLTRAGRTAFEQHVEELKRLVLFQTSER